MAREAYKHLNEGGRIVLMSSNTAHAFAVPRHSVYSGSKGAIESFVKVLAIDCGKKKITVNAVAPGGTVTDMFHEVAKHYIPNGDKYMPQQLEDVRSFSTLKDELTADVLRWLPTFHPSSATAIPLMLPTRLYSWPARKASGSTAR